MSADEIPEGEEVGDDLSEDESGSDDRESNMDRGSVELLSLNAVLSSISSFAYLSSDASNKEDIVYIHSSAIYEILLMLKPALDEAVRYGIAPDVKLKNVLVRLDDLINETRELLGSWHQLMSKVYLVIQNEPVIEKIRALAVYACQLLVPLYPSKRSAKIAESLVKKIQLVHYEKLSDIIKLSVEDQINKKLPRSDYLEKISNLLSLSSNQELLMEAVTLDRLKSKVVRSADRTEFDHLLALVTYMHDCFVKVKQLHSINGVPIPPDFCCPLSLELMSDPVIVASGQTYERAFIKNWLDQGFRVCPKTRQTLGHNNLIPNYTVKALIENWCETNKIKLPDPVKSMNENLPSAFIGSVDTKAEIFLPSTVYKDLASSNGIHRERYLLEKSTSPDSSLGVTSERDCDVARLSLSVPEDNKRQWRYDGQSSAHSNTDLSQSENHEVGDGRTVSRIDSDLTHTSSDVSGEGMQETANSVAPQIEPELMSKYTDVRSSSNAFWQRPSGRFTLNPKIIPSPSSDTRPDLSGVESQVRKLVEELNCDAADVQRTATEELRLLAKHNMENRIVIANCGAIPLLVSLLHSTDPKTQENAVTALLNLSINDNNKAAIANADAIDPLIHVLKTGNAEAKENSAATLFSLSVIEENKVRIGRSGAINPLVDLLGNGTRRGKKDAATALFNLSIFHENKARIVQAGAVRHLVDLMDPAAGMVDKAVAVLANLATIPEGRTAIGHESGIPVLVEVVELGSARGKENAAAALLQLCTNSNKFCGLVLQEGAVPPLVALSQSGTPRGKEKAQALLSYFRNQRHGNAGRA